MASPTLTESPPRPSRCAATIGRTRGDFGFLLLRCGQSVAVHSFTTTSGLRVGYCPIEGHERSVRQRFIETLPDEGAAERAAEMWQRMGSL